MVLNDTCYKLEEKTSNFKNARDICTNLGGKLFQPRNNYTYHNVYDMAIKKTTRLNHGAWIGVVTNRSTNDWTGKEFIL